MYKRIYDSEEIVVDYYHDGKPMIRVTQFQDNHFRDEHFVEIPTTEVELKDKVSKLESKLDECLKHGMKQADELLRLRKENEKLKTEKSELGETLTEYEMLDDMRRKREYTSIWLEYWREKHGESDLTYPDWDAIYQDWYEARMGLMPKDAAEEVRLMVSAVERRETELRNLRDEVFELEAENERLRAEVNGECPRKCHCKHGTDDGIGCDGAPEPDGSCFVWGG